MDLREFECFLVLAEELHFGRTARKLQISQSRVSQLVRSLERRIGGPVVRRTSRRVELTAIGHTLREQLAPGFEQLQHAMTEARRVAGRIEGSLRLGFLCSTIVLPELVREFSDRHPRCEIELREVHLEDPLGPLRRGEVDVLLHWLPVDENDLVVGPTLLSEPRSLAVPAEHSLASRSSVSSEDLAGRRVFGAGRNTPQYWWDAQSPPRTARGRPIHRGQPVSTVHEVLSLVAAGRGVAPMVRSTARFYGRPDVTFVPLTDLPPSRAAPVWRATESRAIVRAFIETVVNVLDTNDGHPFLGDRPGAAGTVEPATPTGD